MLLLLVLVLVEVAVLSAQLFI